LSIIIFQNDRVIEDQSSFHSPLGDCETFGPRTSEARDPSQVVYLDYINDFHRIIHL